MTLPKAVAGTLWPTVDGLARIVEKAQDHQDRAGYFAALYYWVSRGIGGLCAGEGGAFAQPEVAAVVVRGFYQRYFDAHDAVSFERKCTEPWRITYEAAQQDRYCVLQHLLSAMSAHIVFDLAIALSDALDVDEMAAFRGDYETINKVFADLLPGVLEGLAEINPALKPLLELEHLGLLKLLDELLAHIRDLAWAVATERAKARKLGQELSDEVTQLACVALQELVLNEGSPLALLFRALRWHESDDVGRNIELLFTALRPDGTTATVAPERPPKRRVAIIGAGVGGLSTAFYLTDPRSPTGGDCEVTIYQLGWRAGGKGTTGRSSDPAQGNRIQEHGLHAFFGFYENAFRLVHDAYASLPSGNPIPTWREAFEPVNAGAYWDPPAAARSPWRLSNPPDSEMPGTGGIEAPPLLLPPIHLLAVRMLEMIDEQLQILAADPNDPLHGLAALLDPLIKDLIKLFQRRVDFVPAPDPAVLDPHRDEMRKRLDVIGSGLLRHIGLQWTTAAPVVSAIAPPPTSLMDRLHAIGQHARDEVARVIAFPTVAPKPGDVVAAASVSALAAPPRQTPPDLADVALAAALAELQRAAADLLKPATASDSARRLWILLNMGCAALRGLLVEDVFTRGVEVLNDQDFRQWVGKYLFNDSGMTVNSAVMRAVYDASFAYTGGDMRGEPFPPAASFEAGTAVAGALRAFLTYRGAFGFKMVAGTGDSVVAPLCRVLSSRGVKFRYFRVVRELSLEAGTGRIAAVEIEPQAKVIGEAQGGEYDPFIQVKGLSCWPDKPQYDQLENGQVLKGVELEDPNGRWPKLPRETLLVDRDFDDVVLAVPPEVLKTVTVNLSSADRGWADMVTGIESVRTEAMQNWLYKTPAELRLNPVAADGNPVTVSWNNRGNDLNVMSEYDKALDWETWHADNQPKSVIYHCSVMREDATLDTVEALGREFLEKDAGLVYGPGANLPGTHEFDWGLLVAPHGLPLDASRFAAQFQKANTTPSERYVLSVPGSSKVRLPAHRLVFPNLYIAGDWAKTALSCGCMEATVMSAMLASNALTAWPPLELMVGGTFGVGVGVTATPVAAGAVAS